MQKINPENPIPEPAAEVEAAAENRVEREHSIDAPPEDAAEAPESEPAAIDAQPDDARPEEAEPATDPAPDAESSPETRSETRNRGRFQPGESGNPAGRPPGRRNRASVLAEQMLEGEAEAIVRNTIDLALLGKPIAIKLCMDRLAPARRDRPIELGLPPLDSIENVRAAMSATITAVAEGTITPEEGEKVIGMLAAHAEIVKTEELERRIAAIETRLNSEAGPQLVPAMRR